MSGEREQTIVVVGGVAAGASAAARARRCNEHARIIIFEKDAHISFANCGLPYYIGGEITDRDKLLVAKPALFRNRFNVEVFERHEVTAIDRERRCVRVRNHETGADFEQAYDKLILAMGAAPIVPPMDSVDVPNVFTLRTLEDSDRILEAATEDTPRRNAVVIGAGFIGLEMAEQLQRRGHCVTLVELVDQVLPPLDPEMARMVQEELACHGIDVRVGDGLKAIHTDSGRATGVELNSGAVVEADMVLLGVGVRPCVELAKQAGIDLGETGGIRVNEFMQTNDPDVYAAGDSVEYRHTVLERTMRVPLAGPANRAGRIAGQHAATGAAPKMGGVLGTAIVRVYGKAAAMTGMSEKQARKEGRAARSVLIAGMHHAGYYPGAEPLVVKLIYDPETERVLGAQAVGGAGVDKRVDVIATALRFGATVRDLCDVDLCYAPPFGSAKDPVHMAAFTACNDLDGLAPMTPVDADMGGFQVLDVRMPAELERYRFDYAVNIPLDDLRERLSELDAGKPTVVFCHAGLRAYIAARIMLQHGFHDVRVLTGGGSMRLRAKPGEARDG